MSEWQPQLGDRVEFIVPGARTGPRGGAVTGFARPGKRARGWEVYVLWDGVKRPREQMLTTLQPLPSLPKEEPR